MCTHADMCCLNSLDWKRFSAVKTSNCTYNTYIQTDSWVANVEQIMCSLFVVAWIENDTNAMESSKERLGWSCGNKLKDFDTGSSSVSTGLCDRLCHCKEILLWIRLSSWCLTPVILPWFVTQAHRYMLLTHAMLICQKFWTANSM